MIVGFLNNRYYILFLVAIMLGILSIAPQAYGATINVQMIPGAGSGQSCVAANNCFNPKAVNIAPGDTVTWTNNDSVGHTTTSGTPSGNQTGTVWDSSSLSPGATFSHTFQQNGIFEYFDQVHPWMTGVVTVSAPTFPSPPTGLTATASSSSITLSWNPPQNNGGSPIIKYQIQRGTSPALIPFPYLTQVGNAHTTYTEVGNAPTTYTDNSVIPGTTYYYQVYAFNSAFMSQLSNIANATVLSPSTPCQPGTYSTSGNAPCTLAPAGYYVSGSGATSYTLCQPGYTSSVGSTQCHQPAPPPTNVKATAVSSSSINVSWDASPGSAGYSLFRGTTSGETYTFVANTLTNSFTDTGLSAGTFYYAVQAADPSGTLSGNSAEASATISNQPSLFWIIPVVIVAVGIGAYVVKKIINGKGRIISPYPHLEVTGGIDE